MKQRRPRQPQKRKRETWQEYVKRDQAWSQRWGGNPTGYGLRADLEGMRKRLTGKKITSPGDAFSVDMSQPYDGRPSIRCNAAGLKWLQRDQQPDPDIPRTCPYLDDIPCTHKQPDITREAGHVKATKAKPTLQMYLFDQPQWELNYNPCCIEGMYRLSAKLKKAGYATIIELGTSDDVTQEYEVLFGLKPCYKDR